jgi:hypothetical protein
MPGPNWPQAVQTGSKVMKHLSLAEIAVIKARILRGDRYAEIAADYRINQGRIADLKFGRIFGTLNPPNLFRHEEIHINQCSSQNPVSNSNN